MALQSPSRVGERSEPSSRNSPGAASGGSSTGRRVLIAAVITLVLALVAAAFGPVLLIAALVGGSGGGGVSGTAPSSVPGVNAVLLDAMGKAAAATPTLAPQCTGMRWSILAGVAQVESNLAAGRTISPTGEVSPRIIGPALNGSGAGGNRTPIYDSDGGRFDGDTVYDHAVGAWQFIPSSWAIYGRDGNSDGVADPHNVYDNALGAVVHLCGTGARDLSDREQLRQTIYGYNGSWTYVEKVLANIDTFDQIGVAAGGAVVPEASGRAGVVIAEARKFLGLPYLWGGTTPRGFDCSGLTSWAYRAAGVTLPRVSRDQARVGTWIPRSAGLEAVAPGDLLFFGSNPAAGQNGGIHHVAIYLGGGQMINAPRTGTVVREEAVWMSSYAGAVHMP